MAIKHVRGDFFDAEHRADHAAFGFTGSLPARNHPMDPAHEEDGDTYVERLARKRGGRIGRSEGNPSTAHAADPKGYQLGGMVDGAPSGRPVAAPPPQGAPTGALSRATISMPAGDAIQTMARVAQAGKAAGARQAVNAIANQARMRRAAPALAAPQTAMAAAPVPPPAPQDVPGMAKGGFISKAVRDPGRMQRASARAGESTHAYMEQHEHDPGSLGSAARLGLRLTKGDLHRKKG